MDIISTALNKKQTQIYMILNQEIVIIYKKAELIYILSIEYCFAMFRSRDI